MRKGIFREIAFENLSILDIGCGEAPELKFIVENFKNHGLIVGCDICTGQNWKNASLHHNINFVLASAHNLPFISNKFDFVFIKDVLHHISKNHPQIIEEAYTVVNNNIGILRIVEANRYSISPILVYKDDQSHDHFSLEKLRSLMRTIAFGELYGFELLPSFSKSKKNFLWNFFVFWLWLFTSSRISRYFLSAYIQIKERLLQGFQSYYVLSKRKNDLGLNK
jgi:ubiquinone/menaquinone biosynthesis C-methylase UbiE